MQQNTNTNNGLSGRIASLAAVERRKVVIAFCLIAVMAFMWIRLLTGKGEPAAASAATPGNALLQDKGKSIETGVVYCAPPFIEGRNDILTTDCFTASNWSAFFSKDDVERPEYTGSRSPDHTTREQAIKRIAENLRLQITEMGSEPKAFISDMFVKEGGTLNIAAADGEVIFQVIRITRQVVTLECEGMTFEIRLKDRL